MQNNEKYRSIINLNRPESSRHKKMSLSERAAQFSPFAALTGYDDAVKETARLTQNKILLDDDEKAEISDKMNILQRDENKNIVVKIKYFTKDKVKQGGKYITAEGQIKKIDTVKMEIVMKDGTKIAIDDVIQIESDIFNFL